MSASCVNTCNVLYSLVPGEIVNEILCSTSFPIFRPAGTTPSPPTSPLGGTIVTSCFICNVFLSLAFLKQYGLILTFSLHTQGQIQDFSLPGGVYRLHWGWGGGGGSPTYDAAGIRKKCMSEQKKWVRFGRGVSQVVSLDPTTKLLVKILTGKQG